MNEANQLRVLERLPVNERPLLRVIQGLDTAERFKSIESIVEQRAAKYWGIDKGTPLIPVRDDDGYRLDILNATLQKVEGLESRLITWRKRTSANKALESLERNVTFPPKMLPGVSLEPVVAVRLFDNTDINTTLMEELDYEGDPITAVIRHYEQWRVSHDSQEDEGVIVTDAVGLERGYRAFEMFLFGAGGSEFLKKLRAVSLEYFSEQPHKYTEFMQDSKYE
jgi:hypothetical protein